MSHKVISWNRLESLIDRVSISLFGITNPTFIPITNDGIIPAILLQCKTHGAYSPYYKNSVENPILVAGAHTDKVVKIQQRYEVKYSREIPTLSLIVYEDSKTEPTYHARRSLIACTWPWEQTL